MNDKQLKKNTKDLPSEELAVLSALEDKIRRPIPVVNQITWDTFGYVHASGHVTGLSLADILVPSLPENFGNLTELNAFYWFTNTGFKLSPLPESFYSLSKLEELLLPGKRLSSLPASFGRLTALKELILERNYFDSFPEIILSLPRLEMLNLGLNNITDLPEDFGRLGSLRSLNLRENKLTNLPASFGNLTNLKQLYLNWNLHDNQHVKNLKERGCHVDT